MMKRRIAAGLCILTILILNGCKPEQTMPDTNENSISVSASELNRTLPADFKGRGEVFDLTAADYASNTSASVIPITLHCSDGVDRDSYALHTSPTYLSEDPEGSETANGACSSIDNLTLWSQVGLLLDEDSIGDVLDEAIRQQVAGASKESTLMVSNTLQLSSKLFLTNTIYTENNHCIETFYLIDILDEKKIQLYILTRTYDNLNLTEQEMAEMNLDVLMKYCLSSDENRQVYCGVLQSLIEAISK